MYPQPRFDVDPLDARAGVEADRGARNDHAGGEEPPAPLDP